MRAASTVDFEVLTELHRLCREGRLYDVERWIQDGRPLQLAKGVQVKRRRTTSALEIALGREDHATVLLLLCNGYDPNLETDSPLDLALQSRRWDLLDLLLEYGADPHRVDLEDLIGTYDSKLFERFRALGVDLTAGHQLAEALAEHISNKPLFGYAKRHRRADPRVQAELNSALVHHVSRNNEKGVMLCLWAGADPHAPARSLDFHIRNDDDDDDEDEDRFVGFSAIYHACSSGHVKLLEKLGPDPSLDDFDDLYCSAHGGSVVRALAEIALPNGVGGVIDRQLSWLRLSFRWGSTWRYTDVLERLFEVGARWTTRTAEAIAAIRWQLLKIPEDAFVDVMKLLAKDDHCSPTILAELGRTPAIRKRMKEEGFIPLPLDDPKRYSRPRPTRSREVLKKFGVEIPESAKRVHRLPRTVEIGIPQEKARRLTFDRAELFERVWSMPVVKLSDQWGLSGPGLAKACRRLKIPVPPRGYWAKLEAGRRVRRPKLPDIAAGQAEEIVVWERRS